MRISSIEDINEDILPRARAGAPTRRKGSARARRAGGGSTTPPGRAPARAPGPWRLTRAAPHSTRERWTGRVPISCRLPASRPAPAGRRDDGASCGPPARRARLTGCFGEFHRSTPQAVLHSSTPRHLCTLSIPGESQESLRRRLRGPRFWADFPCDPISARAPATRVAGWRGSGHELKHTSARVSSARTCRFRGVTRAASRRRGGFRV
jgi:hypothetical protein